MDASITPRFKPRARLQRLPGINRDFWIVWCNKYEGCGISLEQAYLDWQVQRRFKMFA